MRIFSKKEDADRFNISGYEFEHGVHPRPLKEWPKQILRGKCKHCGVELALPDDICCLACAVRGSK